MQTRSKVVELSGKKFELRKLPPEVGSFIFMRMLGVSMRTAVDEDGPVKSSPAPSAEPKTDTKTTGEMRVRALSFAVFSGGIGFEDFKFIQMACMKVVSSVVARAGEEFPMPVMTDGGVWTPDGEALANNVGMVMQLTTECLVHAFADFFDNGGTGL